MFATGALVMVRSTTLIHSSMALVAMSNVDLTRASDAVVLGDVGAQSTRNATSAVGTAGVLTETTLNVTSTLKGPALTTVVVTTQGGQTPGVIERNHDEAAFAPGQRVVVFLHAEPTGGWTVVGGLQGSYIVDGSTAGNELRHVSLAELLATIRTSR
jgi:hypothetical protein